MAHPSNVLHSSPRGMQFQCQSVVHVAVAMYTVGAFISRTVNFTSEL